MPYIALCTEFEDSAAEAVVHAALSQLPDIPIHLPRPRMIANEEDIRVFMEEAACREALVVYSFVQPELRKMMREESIRLGVRAVDVMGPMMQAIVDSMNCIPQPRAGLFHRQDEQEMRWLEAVQFTSRFDDTKDPAQLLQADIVLIGVSRTFKSPLALVLGHRGFKTANYPIVPEMRPPEELFRVPNQRLFMLTMAPEQLLAIRTTRLQALGLPSGAAYATLDRIREELHNAKTLAARLDCAIIDMSSLAIEEAAEFIVEQLARASSL